MIEVEPIPAFEDNYIWLLHDGVRAIVVDPGDAEPVLETLARRQFVLEAILATHHHGDHTGGIEDLLRHRAVTVFGPARERIRGVTHAVAGGEEIRVPSMDLSFAVLDVPGHTAGHVAYYGGKRLFCGDTLFACGCGRLFEGTAAQMWASLAQLASLPPDTEVFCAHEYTLSNIRFALAVEPGNAALRARDASARALRGSGRPTLPSSIALERDTNPFLRAEVPEVRAAAEQRAGRALGTPVEVFTAIREWKNRF